jgi:hypothetical protein
MSILRISTQNKEGLTPLMMAAKKSTRGLLSTMAVQVVIMTM